ncbi:matrix-remodeling-associated protein 5 [Thalassophryne amazonica]|uniref:matrix-remodeling-associated protein 5 n=1 Tax=Thalassophryne amazonica TaxID=390379 RepID=UPI0014720920|nr:matrix-remodeling-associated protein 5 [Thalassophryne amazonica]
MLWLKMGPSAMLALHALLALMAVTPVAPHPCPRPCSCPQPTELHCTFRSLTTVPAAVWKHVERMNLGFNSISKVTEKSLSGLRQLELLLLHGNDIHNLPDGTFRDLVSLQMLKMSYNKLQEINRNTLQGLWSLARLHIDHNRLEFIHPDTFQGLTSLRLLQLEGNRLQQLHPATFATFTLIGHFHISTLRILYLSDNELVTLPPKLLMAMTKLENLYLHGNPWTCDCNMRWLHNWDKTSPGILKCKKDRALPGGQLCPTCSSPKHLQGKVLQAVENLVCSSPVISAPHRTTPPADAETEVLTTEDFKEPFGNISLGLSDEHGNKVDLKCSIGEPSGTTNITWAQVNQFHLVTNITLSVDLECQVDRHKYEALWRIIAYYSNMPAHLEREMILSEEPNLTYVYRQDSIRDALYYTRVQANIMAKPQWLMQTSVDLQLNRPKSSEKMVKLILNTYLSEAIEKELVRRQTRAWVMIKSRNSTRQVLSAILGAPTHMDCNIYSSGEPAISWIFPDDVKIEAPYSTPDNRVSVSRNGQLVIKTVSHTDAGVYYCSAMVSGDLAVLPFHLTVQESSSPSPGEDTSLTAINRFVGSPISLPCPVYSSPDAEINWILPNSNIVGFHTNSSRARIYSNGTLYLGQSQLLDSGFYKCIAMNLHGVDTRATKVTLIRRKGPIRPVRKFPTKPQSAAREDTKMIDLSEDTAEASGEVEVTQVNVPKDHPDVLRSRVSGRGDTGRSSLHPVKNTWRRQPVQRKTVGARVEARKKTAESRRRINIPNNKLDPKKWAHILAKVRDRNAQSAVTSNPVQHMTLREQSSERGQTTQSQENTEGSSDGKMTQVTTPFTNIKTTLNNTQGPDTDITQTLYSNHDMNTHSTSTPAGQHTAHTPSTARHTTPHINLNSHTSARLQNTAAPLHTVTRWQTNTNITDSSTSFSTQKSQNTNTDVERVTADTSQALEKSKDRDTSNIVANSNKKKTLASYTKPNIAAHDILRSEMRLITASSALTENQIEENLPARLQQLNKKGKDGRRRLNRRKQKLNKVPEFVTTTLWDPHFPAVRTTASTQLKIESPEVTVANFNTTVPFSSRQVASLDRLSHKESTVSRHHSEAATKSSSLPVSTPETKNLLLPLAKPPFDCTSTAPSFPTATPEAGRGKIVTEIPFIILKSASPTVAIDMSTTSQQRLMSSTHIPLKPLLEAQNIGIMRGFGSISSDNFSGDLHMAIQMEADVDQNQLDHQDTPTKKNEQMLLNYLLPDSVTPAFKQDVQSTTDTYNPFTESGFITTLGTRFLQGKLLTEQVTTVKPERLHPSNANDDADSRKNNVTALPFPTPSRPVISPTSTAPLPTDAKLISQLLPPRPAFQEGPRINDLPGRQDSEFPAITTRATPNTGSYSDPTTQLADPKQLVITSINPPSSPIKLTSVQGVKPTPIPTFQTYQHGAGRTTSTQDVPQKHKLPEQSSVLRGKPRIIANNFQTFKVKVETDAQLPCEAVGEPMPFLSWTKVATGASIAQNTRVQRFEVHPNGTLIIRNTQLMDQGQYMCMIQNQFGSDKATVNLMVLSEHPRILQPRHRDMIVRPGGTVNLECKIDGHPTPRVTWELPNRVHMTAAPPSGASHQRVAVIHNGTLHITRAVYADRGIYKCIGSSSVGSDTVSVRLFVLALPPVIQQPKHEDRTVVEGSSAYLHCTATGAPTPHIHWITPDGLQLTASQAFTTHTIFVFLNGTLYLHRLGMGNAGKYECTASNAVAASRRTVTLSIRRNASSSTKARTTSSSPRKTDVIYGGNLVLNCLATGVPEPRIIWRTPSKKLVDAHYSYDTRIKVFPNGTIAIHSVNKKDSGDYLCVARNRGGDDYILLGVNVLTKPAMIEHKQERSSQEVVYGGDLKVDCVASGLPDPEITWALPDGTMVNPVKHRESVNVGRSRRYVVFDNGTLYFNDVGMQEEGDYTCYAENQLGKDEMKVKIKVKVSAAKPQIKDKEPKSISVSYGERVSLKCSANGEPAPDITWISPTKRVISSALDKYQVFNDGTLVIQKAQRLDGGNYTCTAKNSAGQDHHVIRVEVVVIPPMINGLRGTTNTINVTAVQDQRKLMDCKAKGSPTPNVIWVLPGNVVLPAPYFRNRMIVHQNGTLEIRSPKQTDSGKLTCIARNEGGEVSLVVNLTVKEKVEKLQIRDYTADSMPLVAGNVIILNCSSDHAMHPHITWLLPSGTPLVSGARFSKFFHRPDGSLIISNPSLAEVGRYRCLGHNFGGVVEHTITVSPGRKPQINNRYNNPVSVTKGDTLLLHCVTNGTPLRLTWTLPSGVVLNNKQQAGRYAVLSNGTLAIEQVSIYDRGSYVCRAANEYGTSLLTVSVVVRAYPPQITNGPPSVTYAKSGVAVQLNCVVTGVPRAEVTWETPDKTLLTVGRQPQLFGNKYLHPQGSLIIQNPTQKDTGVYRCIARNAIGIDSKSSYLNVF